jgi:hypothetical protein
MSFHTLKELNIKLVDFITLLSPLGVVKKIVSNGDKHLFEIFFHHKVESIKGLNKPAKNTNYISGDLIKLFYDKNYGFIVNDNSCILEIPNNLTIDKSDNDLKKIGKNIRKLIPKISIEILNNGLDLKKRKITNPESINILNFDGYHTVSV